MTFRSVLAAGLSIVLAASPAIAEEAGAAPTTPAGPPPATPPPPAAPPQAAAPPLPSGGHWPPPPGAAYSAPGAEAYELDMRIEQLRRERSEIGLGGPITMLAIGGGVFLVAGMYTLLLLSFESACDPDFDTCDTGSAPLILGVLALGGAGLGIAGAVMLGDRIGERRPLGEEIKRLERERARMQLRYGLKSIPGGAMGGLELRF